MGVCGGVSPASFRGTFETTIRAEGRMGGAPFGKKACATWLGRGARRGDGSREANGSGRKKQANQRKDLS